MTPHGAVAHGGAAASAAAGATGSRPAARAPHPLLDDAPEPDLTRSAGGAGLTPREQADRILAAVLSNGAGPVVLCMPGTLGAPWQSSVWETARALVRQWQAGGEGRGGALSLASLPYPNSIGDAIKRTFGVGFEVGQSVLALVLRGLRERAPHRPVLLVGESQGAWVIARDLEDPELAAAVTRVVTFARPGMAPEPVVVGREAVRRLRSSEHGGLRGSVGWLDVAHVDDIVPNLPRVLTWPVIEGFVDAIGGWLATGEYDYLPHHYDRHGPAAARWLLDGVRPPAPRHHSRRDR